MPTVLRVGGHRFFFYSRETDEPPHVHIQTGEKAAKFWLTPVALARSAGYNRTELRALQLLVEEHREALLDAWEGHFGEGA